ncbi:hypothetical protein [Microbacterium sp. bgisy189]|uniref:hypothetical protein n=1 Tax=Microbacterium sp. bgisy189 TaxID=3413798 RepID=UPI003EB97A29
METAIELVSDGQSLAIVGQPDDVERFMLSSGLANLPGRKLDLHRVNALGSGAGAVVQVGSEAAANSGRWVKLTKESAEAVKEFGLMPTKAPGVSHAMIGKPGEVQKWLQIDMVGFGLLSGPFALTAIATMMQQQAMQRQMDEIVEYLHELNEKVDDILRAQKDAVLADMIGVDLIIEEALTVRGHVGRVSDVTWSKVQATGMTIARTQAYALRQLDAIADKLKKKSDFGDVALATRAAEPQVREWLAVLARTFQLQDGVGVLELDRVFDASPEELDDHRLGVMAAREKRLDLVGRSTARLIAQMEQTVRAANGRMLLNPLDSPAAVRSSKQVAIGLLDFRTRLGLEGQDADLEAKRWHQAASEAGEKILTTVAGGASAAGRAGAEALDRVAGVFREVDLDGDGIADPSRASTALAGVKKSASAIAGGVAARLKRSGAGGDGNSSVESEG